MSRSTVLCILFVVSLLVLPAIAEIGHADGVCVAVDNCTQSCVVITSGGQTRPYTISWC